MILYKYTRAQWIETLLTNGTLAFPLFHQLNDPFESYTWSARKFSIHDPDYSPVGRTAMTLSRLGAREDPAILYENPTIQRQEKEIRKVDDFLCWCRDNLGILSLSSEPHDAVMWAHYGENSAGFCVGIDFDDEFFAEYHPSDSELAAHAGLFKVQRVTYQARTPAYSLGQDREDYVRCAFLTKSAGWSYEKEYRLLRPLADCANAGPVPTYSVPKGLIKVVIAGLNVDPGIGQSVQGICRRQSISLRKMQLKEGYYEMTSTEERL